MKRRLGHYYHHHGWHRRWRHSLRWRLVTLFLLLAVCTTVVFVGGTRQMFSSGWRQLVQPLFRDYVDRLANEIGSPPDLARAQAMVQRLPISVRIEGPVVNWASHAPRGPQDTPITAMLTRTTADGHAIRFGIGAWHSDERPKRVGWMMLAGLLLLLLLAYAYVRRLFKPLDDIRAGALRYGKGDFSRPIPLRRNDELGDLATQVNGMAIGLRRLLDGQRGLLLAISHELRSPLTRARLNAELVAEGESRDALLRDLALMRDLVSDLLESERLAGGAAALQTEQLDLNGLARDLVAQQFAGQAIELVLDDTLPLLLLDRARLQMLLRNLLDNALRHNTDATTPVRLSTQLDGLVVRIVVRDAGPGVDEADLQRLAQPFYRPDAARSRSGGGVGLGLYLCRLVASSHGGTLALRNTQPGLEVSVELPLG
ncbi:HAMP domain-containing protein [Aquincola sp. S2]|uniref:histidine kinase n=1 Tax=Pseudaquabacterium terrae TaxID=2732868 RepID=A0ABX2EHD0_9BURK|nr:ATP-binding protein [Aquabacterium terrae]NRF68029.1 HAMP domain-containing protein [Aquabacterium terrae]